VTDCRANPRCTVVPGCCGGQSCVPVGAAPPVCTISCPINCAMLDEASCKSTSLCVADYCQECSCTPTFVGCRTTSATRTPCPGLGCLQPACCTGLDERACQAAAPSLGCTAEYCPDCQGGQRYVGCAGPNEGAQACTLNCPILDAGTDADSCSNQCSGGGRGCAGRCAAGCTNGELCCPWAGGACIPNDAGGCTGAGGYQCATPTSAGVCPDQCFP
jgi:hypothetical protein